VKVKAETAMQIVFNSTHFEGNAVNADGATLGGGAICVSESDSKVVEVQTNLNKCTFDSNTAPNGGAITAYAVRNAVLLDYCTFKNNGATTALANGQSFGGALFSHCPVTVMNTKFMNNWCSSPTECFGGAVAHKGVQSEHILRIVDTTFSGNQALNGGSGGALQDGSDIPDVCFIARSHFIENRATGQGGALVLSSSKAQVTYSAFLHNTAPKAGGLALATSTATFQHCRFESNTATDIEAGGGAMILSKGSQPAFLGCALKDRDTPAPRELHPRGYDLLPGSPREPCELLRLHMQAK
jgi:predicted outer membrane repeat protein